jgi:hypothetical protein
MIIVIRKWQEREKLRSSFFVIAFTHFPTLFAPTAVLLTLFFLALCGILACLPWFGGAAAAQRKTASSNQTVTETAIVPYQGQSLSLSFFALLFLAFFL